MLASRMSPSAFRRPVRPVERNSPPAGALAEEVEGSETEVEEEVLGSLMLQLRGKLLVKQTGLWVVMVVVKVDVVDFK